MNPDRLRIFLGRRRAATIVTTLLLAFGATQTVHAQSATDFPVANDVSSPTTDTLAQTISRTLSEDQARDLALTAPQSGPGQPLNISGGMYLAGSAGSPLVDQKIAYANNGMSLNVGYRSVSKNVTDADLLSYRTGKDADLPDALNQLLSQRGQNDLNAELGLTGSQGFKLDYKFDALTNSVANSRGVNQSLLLEKDVDASTFSFLHGVASTGASSGAGKTTTTDELKYAYAPQSGLSFTGDASQSLGTGSDTSQWRLGVAEKSSRLNFGGEFWSSDAHQGTSSQDDRQGGERFTLDGQIAPALQVTGFYDHETVATSQTQGKENFDAVIKSAEIHDLEVMAEFARTQQLAQAARAKRILQLTWSLPHFIGVNSAKWVIGLTDRTTEDQALRRDITIGFESQVPGSYGVVPGLSGATLHLEFAGNAIGATPAAATASMPRRLHTTMRHSRLLRLVSAPQTGKWLTWSVVQQTRVGDQGAALPTMRDYEVKGMISPMLSLAYGDRDQIPQDDGSARDTKEQKLSVTISQPHSAQIVAELVHGADMSNGVAQQGSVSLGYGGPVTSNQTMSFSLGRDQRTKVGVSTATGTTCKTAFDWRQDAKNLLGFNGAFTVWDNAGAAKSASVDASAHLNFQHTY